jgi:hypothetical protein
MADSNESSPDERQERERRAYEPPRVLETAYFETLALGCTKLPGTPCDDDNPQSS